MTNDRLTQNITELRNIITKSFFIIDKDVSSSSKNQLIELKNKLLNNLDSDIEFENISYQIISFLATLQIYFKNLVKTTKYKNPEYVTIYWDIVTLKGKFKSLL